MCLFMKREIMNAPLLPENKISSITDILKETNLESFYSIIEERLKSIGMIKYNNDEYVDYDSIYTTFNVFINNPKPKLLFHNYLFRTYNSPTMYSEQNYIEAINLTNELTQIVDYEWFDVFDIVLKESHLMHSKVSGYVLETSKEANIEVLIPEAVKFKISKNK